MMTSLHVWYKIVLALAICAYIVIYLTYDNGFYVSLDHVQPLFPINDTFLSLQSKRDITQFLQIISKLTNLTEAYLNTTRNNNYTDYCPIIPPKLQGRVEIIKEVSNDFKALLYELNKTDNLMNLELDGHYAPKECRARSKIAIVVPYRDRVQHLKIFLRNMHPFLQKQQLDYIIYIVEQFDHSHFNRASLMNIGFVEGLKLHPDIKCFVFHDVDLLPEDDRNMYGDCPEQPRHLSAAVDVLNYRLPYYDIFGGVSSMRVGQFIQVNGFSNKFWGWGGEDDDMAERIKGNNLHITRYPMEVARYTMLHHNKEKANPKRFETLYTGRKRFKTDGLNSLEYKLVAIQKRKLFTWILVKLEEPNSIEANK